MQIKKKKKENQIEKQMNNLMTLKNDHNMLEEKKLVINSTFSNNSNFRKNVERQYYVFSTISMHYFIT